MNAGRHLVRQRVNVLEVLYGNNQDVTGVIGMRIELPGSHESHHLSIPVNDLTGLVEEWRLDFPFCQQTERAGVTLGRVRHLPQRILPFDDGWESQ